MVTSGLHKTPNRLRAEERVLEVIYLFRGKKASITEAVIVNGYRAYHGLYRGPLGGGRGGTEQC